MIDNIIFFFNFFLNQELENPQYEHFYTNVSNPKWDPSSGFQNDEKRRAD